MKKIASSGTRIRALQTAFPVTGAVLPLTKNLKSLQCIDNGHKKLKKLDNVKIVNLKRKNRDHKKYLSKMKILVTCKFYYI